MVLKVISRDPLSKEFENHCARSPWLPVWNNAWWLPIGAAGWYRTGTSTQRKQAWHKRNSIVSPFPLMMWLVFSVLVAHTWRRRPARRWAWRQCSWAGGWATGQVWAPSPSFPSGRPRRPYSEINSNEANETQTWIFKKIFKRNYIKHILLITLRWDVN